jgi:uncharacterized protein YrrD
MRTSAELNGLPVIAIEEARELGKVRDLVIDPKEKSVRALLIEDREWFRNPKALLFSSVRGVGPDAVIVDNSSCIISLASSSELDPYLVQPVRVINAQAVSTEGRFIGRVTEFFVDTNTGKITGCEVASPSSSQKPVTVPTERIRALTNDLLLAEEVDSGADVPAENYRKRGSAQSTPAYAAKEAPPRADTVLTSQPTKQPVAPVPSGPQEAPEGKERKVLEERQDAYLLGKEVRRDVFADDGSVIIKAGETISPVIIDKAKEADKYLALSFSIRRA